MSIGTTRPVSPGWRAESRHDLGTIGGLGPHAVHVRGQARLRDPQVEARERVEGLAERRSVRGHERGQLVEDAGDLLGLRDLRLPPRVAQLDHDERLDEERLAAARRVVDDALDPRPRLGLDRHHVAAVAQRDDRLLERAAQLRADERVQAPAQPVVGDPDGRAQAAQPRRGRVEQLPDRVEAARERAAQRRQRMQLAPEVAQERPPLVGERRSRGAPSRRASRRSRGTGRAPAGRRGPPARWPGRCRAPRRRRPRHARSGASGPGRSHRGRAPRPPGRRTVRGPRPAGAPAGTMSPRRGAPGRAGTPAGRSSAGPSAVVETRAVSAPSAARRRTGGRRRANRHGRLAHGSPAYATPIRGGRPDRLGPGSESTGPSRRSGDAGSHRSSPVTRRSIPKAAPTRPGPAGEPVVGRPLQAGALARPRHGRGCDGAPPPRAPDRPASVDRPSSGSTARTSRADAPASGPVTTFRQSYIP